MSTYINPMKPNRRSNYDDCPAVLSEYLIYSESIRGLSPRSVNGYYIDLRTFFKFLKLHRKLVADDLSLEEIEITDIDISFIKQIDKSEVYEYLYYVTRERENAAAARARKLSSLRGFFRYLTNKSGQLSVSPVEDIETPKMKKRLPKYLSLDESVDLLKNIQSDFYERDYCMVTLFLNCGMRVSELVGINVTDIKEDTLRVVGKGNKERTVYLNTASQVAIQNLLEERAKVEKAGIEKALFISKKTGKRLSVRRVQQLIESFIKDAGLDGKGYSVHTLRHTAATLMYQYGHVDMLALKEILGHVDVSTTQIYTHLDTRKLKDAAAASPLANITVEKPEKEKNDDLEEVE